MNWYLEDQHKSVLLELAKSSVRFTTELIGKKKKERKNKRGIDKGGITCFLEENKMFIIKVSNKGLSPAGSALSP